MIVPMKKVSLFVLESEKRKTLKALRRLGVLHIEITEGGGERLTRLQEKLTRLETAMAAVAGLAAKDAAPAETAPEAGLQAADDILTLMEEREADRQERLSLQREADRLKAWGEVDPAAFAALSEKGFEAAIYEMPPSLYKKLGEDILTLPLFKNRQTVRFLAVKSEAAQSRIGRYLVPLPTLSTKALRERMAQADKREAQARERLTALAAYLPAMKAAAAALRRDAEFETYASGMESETLSPHGENGVTVAYFSGFIPAKEAPQLQAAAKTYGWGLALSDPTPEDNAPTKLQNNKLVSLIYPLTDFLGTVPGYFEYDISGWFLSFILIFFGIIFGDGGYGLLICGVAGALILKSRLTGRPIPSAYLLILLMGGATVLWGVLTCTWFGLSPALLPLWLQRISLPVISNVYADKLWYPFWTNGAAGLTTTQNLQILCFTLALVQLAVAHIMGMVRNRKSLKLLGDLGSLLMLTGIYYIVLMLVVNGAVFPLGLKLGPVPVGIVAVVLIGVGFIVNFVFANYAGSIKASVLASLKGIVSCLLGVVNVFSDIVSYIRLWAVGLAGAAISATVNDLAGPLFGNFLFIILAIFLLVFGHGLNMILNVLSVIVHGVRLNTLEFSTHLDMSWSGRKFKPFRE